jgi:predicted amidohydrolase YtcJ
MILPSAGLLAAQEGWAMVRTVEIPWLCDRHSHVSLYAALAGCPDLAGLLPGDAMALLRNLPRDRVSTVVGWHSTRLRLGDGELDALPPAILVNFSLHGFWLTPAALPLLEPDQPELVAHRFDPEWCERNMEQALVFFGASAGLTRAKLDAFMTGLRRVGVGTVEDMLLTGAAALEVIRESPWRDQVRCWASPKVFAALGADARDAVTGIKLFTDGALGARTAALAGAFLDGGRGLLLHSDAGLEQELAGLHGLGKPLAIHAIGGRAIEQALTVLERLERQGLTFPWVRLEHVQFITLDQARRAKALGLILSMQPNFNSDSVDYADRLEPADLAGNNPFRMLLDQAGFRCGEDLILGSDGMPHGVEYALQWTQFPPYPGQRLTVDELIAGYGLAPEGQGLLTLAVDEERREVRRIEV